MPQSSDLLITSEAQHRVVAKADAQKMYTEPNFVVLETGEEYWGCRSAFGGLSPCVAFPSDPLSQYLIFFAKADETELL